MNRPPKRTAIAALAAAALAAPLLVAASAPSLASSSSASPASQTAERRHHPGAPTPGEKAERLARKLVKASSGKDAYRYLRAFQAIADDNGGTRVAGSPGHEASAAYVGRKLEKAGYRVSYEPFDFVYTEPLAEKLAVVSPTPRDVAINLMTYTTSTPEGGITAPLAVVPVDATTGCEAADYAGSAYTGRIALIQRGGCTFAVKQAAAADAGAVGAVIYNNTAGAVNGTLGDPTAGRIPSGGITQADGEALAADAAAGEVRVTLEIREFHEERTTYNVLAETRAGDADRTVMLGAHLDSVAKGPGINDNASGSAGLLEVALELARTHDRTANKVRFAWWSAEEYGLLGSEAYVAALSAEQREQIRLYLNFDMIASPNYAQFVYDGDDSDGVGAGPGPEGSAQLEKAIGAFLDSRGLPHEGTDFTGRSDYGPFIEVGIPAGGTFTGAEVVKTEDQAARYGGTAGVAFDPCYHLECDGIDNISRAAFDVNIDVMADAVGRWAQDLAPLYEPAQRGSGGSAPSAGAPAADGAGATAHDHERVAQ